jgi:cytochrome c-type biogenesis protein CcmE
MKARTKFLIGGLLVLGPVGYLMASSIKQTGVYYLTPSELSSRLAADSSFRNVGVKVGARVVPGSIERDPGGREYAFRVTDGAKTFPVVYRGIAPDLHRQRGCRRRGSHGARRNVSRHHPARQVRLPLRERAREIS